ncbi:hypothetical protein GKE82_24200 [Conexibacter sp. W3-3-2]|uniref:hypothetical protein n=1 Tax=Conexibacter sp. W3-3-2 TaxID=2675227 RepID=UPI0012B89672|nr:hypothetical protein [Conexibacter sp. W3-3-2]MTD47311.1 hypothetical protein [Conexibacter sp. W3-3-2]
MLLDRSEEGRGGSVTACSDVAEPLSADAVRWFIDQGVTPTGAKVISAACSVEDANESLGEIRDGLCAQMYCGPGVAEDWEKLDTE